MFKDPGSHVTGVFGSGVHEPMPPNLVFETQSMKEENMMVKPSCCSNLPIVVGFWGFKKKCAVNSHFVVQKRVD